MSAFLLTRKNAYDTLFARNKKEAHAVLKRVFAVVLALVLFITSSPVCATDGIGYEPIVFSFDSKRNMLENKNALYVYSNSNDHGKYETVSGEEHHIKFLYDEHGVYAPYRCAPCFRYDFSANYSYMRVVYRTSDTLSAKINLRINNNIICLVPNTARSKGEWTVSAPIDISGALLDRLTTQRNVILEYTGSSSDSDIAIKELILFKSAADAYKYYGDAPASIGSEKSDIRINGNDISKYKIVISENATLALEKAANTLKNYIKSVSGKTVSVVSDNTEEGEYEILLGVSKRKLSNEYVNELVKENGKSGTYVIQLAGNTLVISSCIPATLEVALDAFFNTYLYEGDPQRPKIIDVSGSIKENAVSNAIYSFDNYTNPENLTDPVRICNDYTVYEKFASDNGYFTEENGEDKWRYENGEYIVNATDDTLSYIHVYESNVYQFARLRFADAGNNAEMGLIARYTAADAYIKAGYDFSRSEWYIDYREGYDLYLVRAASIKADIKAGKTYNLCLVTNGNEIGLVVDGKHILEAEVPHITPGRVGVYARDMSLAADEFKVHFLSGEGTVLRNVEHNILPGDTYREGGTVIEKNNGTLIYQHKNSVAYLSTDNGKTWEKTSLFIKDYSGYLQILRLADGRLMCIVTKTVNGTKYHVAKTYNDDGKTWTEEGLVAPVYHSELGIVSSNMNDKLTQSGTTGYLYFTINYYAKDLNGKRYDFCEYFYSKDGGKTWQKSRQASHTLPGNTDNMYFGENKILQCADGTLRMYCSWNNLGNIMYSISRDDGRTWSRIYELDGFISSRSSMQFVRDPYGPTDTTYYMLWLRDELHPGNPLSENRTQLCLAYSTDGMNWEYIGDIWRNECRYSKDLNGVAISHLVDPFIQVTEDYIICGSGVSEKIADTYHNAQRQHIWSIARDSLPKGTPIK